MKNLSIDLLRAFVSVAQLGSFTRAGELLGRSQPAVTLKVKRLEQLVEESLFIRTGKNLELSAAGTTLYEYAEQILSLNDLAISQFSKSAVAGKIRLGIPSEFATLLLPKIVRRFAKAYPNVTLEVNCELSKHLLTPSGRDNHDLILALGDTVTGKQSSLIKTDDLVWVASVEQKSIKVQVVPLIVATEGCIYRHTAIKTLESHNLPWQIVYTNPDLTGIQYAIQENLGVTVLARSTVPNNLKIMPPSAQLPDLGQVNINLIMGNKRGQDQAIGLLAEFLRASLS